MSSPSTIAATSPSSTTSAANSAIIQNLLSSSSPAAASAAGSASGADERALMMLLQDEVKRLHSQKSEKNNETRTLLEMKVAIEQLETVTDQRRRLTEDVAKERSNNEKLQNRIKELEKDAELKGEQRKVSEHHLGEKLQELQQQLDKVSCENDANKERLSATEKELSLTKERAVSAKKEYKASDQVNFEQSTILKTRLTQALNEIDALKEEGRRETSFSKELQYDLSQSAASSQREKRSIQHDLDAERRAHIEDVAELKKALNETQLALSTAQSTFEAHSRIDQEKVIRLTSEMQLLKEKANSDAQVASAREKLLDETNMKMVSDLKVAQQEINSMSSQEWADKKALTQKLIEITVARDVAIQDASDAKEKFALALQDANQQIAQLQNQLTQASTKFEHDSTRRNLDATEQKRKASELQAKLDAALDDCHKLTEAKQELSFDMEKGVARRDAEINSLRIELRATVETLHRLEKSIMDNVQVKLLTDENASLREQCDALKTRVVEMTSNLANMRAEADISENARVSSIQGLVADYHRRIVALEKEQRFSRPLIKDLAALSRKHALLDAVLERDLELYNTSFNTN